MGQRRATNYTTQCFATVAEDRVESYNPNLILTIISLGESLGEIAAAGVVVTAEIRTTTSQNIGADPTYLASLDENIVAAVPK